MNKRNLVIFVCLCLYSFNQQVLSVSVGSTESNQIDTVLIKDFVKTGDRQKSQNADSGLYYYQNALTVIEASRAKNNASAYYSALCHFKMATIFIDLHKMDEAVMHNSSALTLASKSTRSNRLIAQLINNKALIYLIKSNYDSAVFYCRKALKLSKDLQDKNIEAQVYVNFGNIEANEGKTDTALFYFNKALVIGRKINDKDVLANTYTSIGKTYSNIGKLDKALTNLEEALKLFESAKDLFHIILCENNIANIYFLKSDYVNALDRYNLLVNKCLKINNQTQLSKVYHNIGESYYNIYAFNEATVYYLKSIEIKQKLNDKLGESSDYSSLGSVQISNDNPKKALEYYRKAISILKGIDNKKAQTRAYNNLANAFIELNIKDSVIFYLDKAQNIAKKISEPYQLSSAYFNYAQFYKNNQEYAKALTYYEKLVKLNEELEDPESVAMACNFMASIYTTLGKKDPTKKYFQKALQQAFKAFKLSEENNMLEVRAQSSKHLKEVYIGLGDFKKAIFYYNIYDIAMDSLYRKTQSDAAIYAEARWQADKKQHQINFLEQEKKLKNELITAKESENRKQKTAIYLLIAGLIILLTSAGLIIYFVRKQRRLQFQQQLNKMSMLRLENARGRVSPHFLFNSLSSIQDELSDKPEAGKRLDAIVNMLRCSLLNVEKPYITLAEEMEFVENYILLQKAKHDLLQTEIYLDSPDLGNLKIPAMIVQIPVENAIKHGLAGKQAGEKILKVNACAEDGFLKVSVVDNGIGRDKAGTGNKVKGTGTGLKVISQTLHLLNSRNLEKIEFALVDLKDETGKNCGTKVDISIPLTYNFEILN
jgi:tetratricopeptide (TPR) repeat protein